MTHARGQVGKFIEMRVDLGRGLEAFPGDTDEARQLAGFNAKRRRRGITLQPRRVPA
jgi:hypothetical protein